jgi:hypothetical protein
MLRVLGILLALVCYGCGYIGEPLPPALNIPVGVRDLSGVERGPEILVRFTLPTQTTDGLPIRKPSEIELRVGPLPQPPFSLENWIASSKVMSGVPADRPVVEYTLPAAEWIGRDVVIGVKVLGPKGRASAWSNLVTLSVVPPLDQPTALAATAVPQGVRLTWSGSAPRYRIYRRIEAQEETAGIAETERAEYLDAATEYGKTYRYSVQGIRSGGEVRAESQRSFEIEITPKDIFPPAVPTGLTAVASTGSIELVWDRNSEPDLAGYRVYRAEGPGGFQHLADTQEAPSFSDRKIEPGKKYRYAVSALDKSGNESAKSAPVELTAP